MPSAGADECNLRSLLLCIQEPSFMSPSISETFSRMLSSVPFSVMCLPIYDVCLMLTMFHSGLIFRSGILQSLNTSRLNYILP